MPRLLICLLVCLFFGFMPGQNQIAEKYASYFQVAPLPDYGISILEINKRTFSAGYYNDSTWGFYGTSIVRLDSTGNPDIIRKLRPPTHFHFVANKVIKKNESAFYAFGETYDYINPGTPYNGLMLKINLLADTVFSKRIADTNFIQVSDVINARPGSFYVLAKQFNPNQSLKTSQVIYEIDTMGTLMKKIVLPQFYLEANKFFHDQQRREFVILGQVNHTITNGYYFTDYCLVVDDSTFTVKHFDNDITSQVNDVFYDAIEHNGAYYVNFSSEASAPNIPWPAGNKLKLVKLKRTSNGFYRSYNQTGPIDYNGNFGMPKMVAVGKDLIISTKHQQIGPGFMYCDTMLNYNCYTSLPFPGQVGNFVPFSFFVTNSYELVGTGYFERFDTGERGTWHFKTVDYRPYPAVLCELTALGEHGKVPGKTYPNPASDFVTVKLNIHQPVTPQVFDLAGTRIPCRHSYSEGEMTVEVSDLPAGVYVLRYEYNNEVFVHKILKE